MLQDDSDYAELINQNFLFRFIELRNELRCAALPSPLPCSLPCSPLCSALLLCHAALDAGDDGKGLKGGGRGLNLANFI